jgi:hypothetical protein
MPAPKDDFCPARSAVFGTKPSFQLPSDLFGGICRQLRKGGETSNQTALPVSGPDASWAGNKPAQKTSISNIDQSRFMNEDVKPGDYNKCKIFWSSQANKPVTNIINVIFFDIFALLILIL